MCFRIFTRALLLFFSFSLSFLISSCSSPAPAKTDAPGYLKHDAVATETWLLVSQAAAYHLTYTRTGDTIKGKLMALNNIDDQRDVNGSVKGNQIQFTVSDQLNPPQEFKGAISGDGQSISGPCSFNGNWGYKWSATNINEQF